MRFEKPEIEIESKEIKMDASNKDPLLSLLLPLSAPRQPQLLDSTKIRIPMT